MPGMKYFKNVFCFVFFFFIINFINIFFGSTVLAAVADIDHIVFTTEAQTILPDTISGIITIQTQNANGILETIDETADLSVSVTSPTGQFNSNSTTWNPATTFTMSKNTGNKNFYYKDSALGSFTINATLTTRTTGKSWSTSQIINISNTIEDIIATTTATSTGNITSTSTISIATTTNPVISTHYIQEELSSYVEPTIFEISAGRNRLGYVGLPVNFTAKHKLSANLQNKNCNYVWTFGDGSSVEGEETEHIYKYIGDYNLVLNGECGELKSVSRAKVKIIETNLWLSVMTDGAIEIVNNGEYEINLYGWKLLSANQDYAFPLDTIISGGKKIVFPKEYIKIADTTGISLVDASGGRISTTASSVSLEKFIEDYKKLISKN
jgi:hypothetical protein